MRRFKVKFFKEVEVYIKAKDLDELEAAISGLSDSDIDEFAIVGGQTWDNYMPEEFRKKDFGVCDYVAADGQVKRK